MKNGTEPASVGSTTALSKGHSSPPTHPLFFPPPAKCMQAAAHHTHHNTSHTALLPPNAETCVHRQGRQLTYCMVDGPDSATCC